MSEIEEKKQISRRDLLKVLGAAGVGVVGSMMLPGKWSKPVTRMGVLPAHAQSSVQLYNIIRSAEVEDVQQDVPTLTLTVYIDPPDSGIPMKASYELGFLPVNGALPNPPVIEYDPPIVLPVVNTTDGASTFEPLDLIFESYPYEIRITYEFNNPANCDVTCNWIVNYSMPR